MDSLAPRTGPEPARPGFGNLVALRILAGLLLIYGNGLLLVPGAAQASYWGAPLSRFALDLMFSVGGYASAEAWMRLPRAGAFLRRRVWRTGPGLAAFAALAAFGLGPAFTRLAPADYFAQPMTWQYLRNLLLWPTFWLPGVFEGQAWVGTVNPMLWTLAPAALLWLGLPLVGRLRPARAAGLLLALAVLFMAAHAWCTAQPIVTMAQDLAANMTAAAPFLLVGAALRFVQQVAGPGPFRADVAMLLFGANWAVASLFGPADLWLEWLSLPYMLACVARGSLPALAWAGRWGNPAFGMLLYGFPIQQALVALWPGLAWQRSIALCAGLALAAGYLSWHLLERPCLARRARGPAPPEPGPIPAPAGRHNNFDALRLMAALAVLFGHGVFLAEGRVPGLLNAPVARLGLDVFFSISGYLVTASWLRTPHPHAYLARRARRIFPGLAACVLLTVFVLGPLATRLPVSQYLADPGTWRYLANIALRPIQPLPGVFEQTGAAPGVVNGSLWSLAPEFACYLLLIPLAAVRPGWGAGLAAVLGAIGMALFARGSDASLYDVSLPYALIQVPFFLSGSVLARLAPSRPGLFRTDAALLALVLSFAVPSWTDPLPFQWLATPYIVICFGRLALPGLRRAARFGDLSYGLYLYAFPVQQLVLERLAWLGHPVRLALLLTLPMALLSWHLVERRALTWRPTARPLDAVQ